MPKRSRAGEELEEYPARAADHDLETVMHRLYHLTICKARINSGLKEHAIVERRQEEEESQLCDIIGQYLKQGVAADAVAHMLDNSPLLNDSGKHVFRTWVDVACLRVAKDEQPPLKARRRRESSVLDLSV